jgi:hypothetical protein
MTVTAHVGAYGISDALDDRTHDTYLVLDLKADGVSMSYLLNRFFVRELRNDLSVWLEEPECTQDKLPEPCRDREPSTTSKRAA